ncbi:ABC transporter permease [Bifidobacterium sp. ESL0764]|uniref:COG1361 S-layer family protein n=1 Tax=Bifidobacterium sp. ESL0764 TaxID=2983228 RepID=UPI0023F99242|nr:ABC transporter permease [Bifidobacterium sp. ESL0764]WEV66383.1 ABC transporter permease [Bifidobacterium sp. ESL0764]
MNNRNIPSFEQTAAEAQGIAADATAHQSLRNIHAVNTIHAIHSIVHPLSAHHPTRLVSALLAIATALCLVWGPALLMPQHHAYADETEASATKSGSDNSGATVNEPMAGPVPNIIITNFTYGDGSIPVGGNFNLGFTFQNKGQVAVQNMVVTVDGGDMLTIAGGTNTFYVDFLAAGYSLTETVPMQALADAKTGAQGVSIHFNYEYVENNQRSSASADIKVSVPLSQPDRMQLNAPTIPETTRRGEETTITLAYVNKGKGDVSNLEATLEGEGFKAATPTQYLGNVASGANGSIGYLFTPERTGKLDAKLKVSYEDSNGKPQSKEFPVSLQVEAPAPPPEAMASQEAHAPNPLPFIIIGVVVLVLIIALIVILVRRHHKKKARLAALADDDDDDDDWDGESADTTFAALPPANTQGTNGTPTQVIQPVAGNGTSPASFNADSGILQPADTQEPQASTSAQSLSSRDEDQ